MVGRIVNEMLSKLGYKISKNRADVHHQPPRVLKDPIDAIYMYGHPFLYREDVALEIPVSDIVNPLGFGYGVNDWNPFVETLKEGADFYENSALKRYYDTFQPESAADALRADFTSGFKLRDAPAYACRFLTPWTTFSVGDAINAVEGITRSENKEHGNIDLGIEGGDLLIGPVNDQKGEIEFNRLQRTFNSIKKNGYVRDGTSDGDIKVSILEKDGRYKYLLNGGIHRTAVVSALGYKKIPSTLLSFHVIDLKYINSWPQVRLGLWDENNAKTYFNFLFQVRHKTQQ